MRYMGIDFGTKRVGLALSDESGVMAFPEAVLPNDSTLLARITSLILERGVERVILGESLDYKNNPNKLMGAIEAFKRELEGAGVSVSYEPEVLTSAAAARLQGEGENLDASAAALILQGYLDKIKHSK